MDQPYANINHEDNIDFLENPSELKSSGNWVLTEPIEINGSAMGVGAHNWTWAVSQDWCSGSGSEGDPFLIENVSISLGNSEGSQCIKITDSNSTTYVRINNCTLTTTDTDGDAIYLSDVYNVEIFTNNITGNTRNGIYIIDSINCTIYYNIIALNNGTGILIVEDDGDSLDNLIYRNNFDDNGVNGNDSCAVPNSWDNGSLGNDWDDYGQYDGDDDGIGDVKYNVPGTAGADDNYPIYDDGTEPVVSLSDDDDVDDLFEDEKEPEEFEINWTWVGIAALISGLGVVVFLLVKKKVIRPSRIKAKVKSTTKTVKSTPRKVKSKAKKTKSRARAIRR